MGFCHIGVPPVLPLPELPVLSAKVRVRQPRGPHEEERESDGELVGRGEGPVRLGAVEGRGQRREESPVRINEPEAALNESYDPEPHRDVGEEQKVEKVEHCLNHSTWHTQTPTC